jgi:hypothetical protein
MESSAPILGLPGRFGEPKWPKLEEAVHFFAVNGALGDRDFWLHWTSAHRADEDCDATDFVYQNLVVWKNGNKDLAARNGLRVIDGTEAPPG